MRRTDIRFNTVADDYPRMRIDIALCQYTPVRGDPEANAERIEKALRDGPGDVVMLPEMFLTGYGFPCDGLEETTERCIGEISDLCRMLDKAAVVGAPRFESDLVYNSMVFLSPDGDSWYDKAHLASFGVYAETGFAPGYAPAMGSYHGVLFGMSICYDIFFPEILHGCSLNGASVNICSAASAVQSKPFLDRVLPARALEDVTYLAYINNVGSMDGLMMHGCSRGLDPFGDVLAQCGDVEGSAVFTVDTDRLEEARNVRRHLSDYRADIDWGVQGYDDERGHPKVLIR